jgi:very-short-patch-repair endonuclease
VSQYQSENLVYELIRGLLAEERFGSLKVILHLPLKYLVFGLEGLLGREKEFVGHPFSHVDFAIFNRFDKRPVLVVEVDGYQFHQLDPRQRERDEIKDRLLAKEGTPMLRLRTDGSDEENQIRIALERVISCPADSESEQTAG